MLLSNKKKIGWKWGGNFFFKLELKNWGAHLLFLSVIQSEFALGGGGGGIHQFFDLTKFKKKILGTIIIFASILFLH
jgi:hypothetical protein